MRAYLDNNIIIDIEQNKLSIPELSANIGIEITEVYYSAAHIHEMNEISANDDTELKYRLNKRFKIISEITQNKYLFHELPSNSVYLKTEFPQTVFKTINEVAFARDSMKSLINLISEEQREVFRNHLGINMVEINNFKPNEVVGQINKKLSILQGLSFLDLIEKGIEYHPDGTTFGIHNRFAGIFELLDMIGYWKDKYNEKSNYARLWDSNHAYFASFCDIFVSNDKRTRNKASVAYDIFNFKTIVCEPYKK